MDFKRGDRVRIKENYYELRSMGFHVRGDLEIGLTGEIITIVDKILGIKFDKQDNVKLHDLDGHTEFGFGYYLTEDMVEYENPLELEII